jgi:hypothetical protein
MNTPKAGATPVASALSRAIPPSPVRKRKRASASAPSFVPKYITSDDLDETASNALKQLLYRNRRAASLNVAKPL